MILKAILLGAILQTAPSADMEQKVSFTSRGDDFATVLQRLEETTKVRMKVAAGVPSHHLVIKVKDVPLKELVAKISLATTTESRVSDGILYFAKSAKSAREAERIAAANRLTMVAKWRAKELENLKKVPTTADGARDLRSDMTKIGEAGSETDYSAYDRTPLRAITSEILLSLPDEAIAITNDVKRVVFSSRPSALQRQLDLNACNRIIQKYLEGMIAWMAQEYEGAGDDPETVKYLREQEYRMRNLRIERAHLVVTTETRGGDRIYCELHLFDATGERLQVPLQGVYMSDDMGRGPGAAPKDRKTTPFKLHADDTEFSTLLQNIAPGQNKETKPLTPKFLERIRRPDKFEPLSFSASDLLFQYWDDNKMNGVASPTDLAAFVPLYYTSQAELADTISMLSVVNQAVQATLDESTPGWSVLPYPVNETVSEPRSRAIEARFMQACEQNPDQIVELARDMLDVDSDSLSNFMDGAVIQAILIFGSMEQLEGGYQGLGGISKVYTSLTAEQKSILLRGGSVNTSAISEASFKALRKAVYGQLSNYIFLPSVERSAPSAKEDPEGRQNYLREMENQLFAGYSQNQYAYVQDEATLSLAEGVGNGVITARNHAIPMIQVYDGKRRVSSMAVEGFGSTLYWYTRPASGESPDAGPWHGKKLMYRLTNNMQVRISIMFGQGRGAFGVANGTIVGGDSPLLSYEELPAAMRAQFEKEMKDAKDGMDEETRGVPVDAGTKPPLR